MKRTTLWNCKTVEKLFMIIVDRKLQRHIVNLFDFHEKKYYSREYYKCRWNSTIRISLHSKFTEACVQ